jgi:aryl-alcohol dehydrogenase-like predicted oxidoreductase
VTPLPRVTGADQVPPTRKIAAWTDAEVVHNATASPAASTATCGLVPAGATVTGALQVPPGTRTLDAEFDHPGTPARLTALLKVAKDADATINQVVLAWLIDTEVPMIPLVGASSVAQWTRAWPPWTWS